MAIRNIGGVPVYSIDVEVPKPTDSRGRGYGLMVSDLRWKLWEEVKDAQLQQMKFDQLSYQMQADILKQQQEDLSRAMREATIAKAKMSAKSSSPSTAVRDYVNMVKAGGYTETTVGPPTFMGIPVADQPDITVTKTRTPLLQYGPPFSIQSEKGAGGGAQVFHEYDPAALDNYIADLENRQKQLDEMTQSLAVPRGGNILDRTREAYQTQIGEGGFGISPRRLRELPRFDETAAVGALKPMVDVKSRMNELEMLFPQDYKNLPEWSNLSNKLDKMQQVVSEARPVSARQFLRKEQEPLPPTSFEPKYDFGNFVPSEMTNKQDYIQRLSDKSLLRSEAAPNVSAEEELIQLGAEAAARRAQPVGISNASRATMQRALELEALGVPALDAATKAVAGELPYSPSRPFEKMAGVETEMSGLGKPGGVLDTARYLRQKRMEANVPVTPAPAPTPARKPIDEVIMSDPEGNPILPLTPQEELKLMMQEDVPKLKENFEQWKAKQNLMKSIKEVPEGVITSPEAKATPQNRSDLYAMRVTKAGLELAQKPDKFARIAKTELPKDQREKAAPAYVILVDKLYNVNKNHPNAFKDTYDEIARTYKDDPKLREAAQSYLVAKDVLEGQVTSPLAKV